MKKTIHFLWAVVVLTFVLSTAQAQPFGPQLDNTYAYTNSAVFQVNGGSTTNLTAAQKKLVWLSDKGFSFTCNMGSTNAATATNILFRFEFSQDTTNWFQQFTHSQAPGGVGGSILSTNIATDLVRNYRFARLHSIQNTNVATGTASNLAVFLTNTIFAVRQ